MFIHDLLLTAQETITALIRFVDHSQAIEPPPKRVCALEVCQVAVGDLDFANVSKLSELRTKYDVCYYINTASASNYYQ